MLKSLILDWRFVRFVFTGMLNTAFGYGVYVIGVYFGLNPEVALFLAYAIGILFNYQTNRFLVFQDKQGSFWLFAGSYIIPYCFNAGLLYVVNRLLNDSPYLAQLICLPPTVLLTYVLLKYVAFGKGSQKSDLV
jgi:putative flippase GtrA